MRINHNIAALNTHRQLSSASSAQGKSMEKLSSGLRINKAGDDAAGLAISEKMRGQIRGLDQASRNAQDGISLIQTGEGALNETHDILQRMRELAVQSSNDTNTNDDRAEIQKEVTQLAEEVTRIAKNTEFNTQNLLDGNFTAKFQIGSNAGQNLDISINAMDSTALSVGTGGATTYAGGAAGSVTGSASNVNISALGTYTGDNATGVTVNTANLTVNSTTTYSGGSAGNLNNTTVVSGLGDITGTYNGNNAAGVTLATESNFLRTTVTPYSAGTVSGTATGGVNNVNLSGSFNQADTFAVSFTDDVSASGTVDSTSELLITASSGDTYTLTDNLDGTYTANNTSTPGNSFTFNTDAFEADSESFNFAVTAGPSNTTYSGDVTFGSETIAVSSNGSATFTNGLTVDFSNAASGANTSTVDFTGASSLTSSTYGGSIDIGGTSFTVASNGAATGATGTYAGLTVDVTGAAANETGTFDISGRTGSTSAVVGIDVSTQAAADSAITVINDAIKTVSTERSKLGAYQNRLEHTINNLNTSSENLTAAESRVRDVDMAKEMMNQTKNSILAQAAQAMLAQANQQPQGVLQLLR